MNLFKKVTFSKDAIEVFAVNLKNLDPHLPKFIPYLSEKEKVQANEFRFEHLKNNYVASHGILRILLGNYLSCVPSEVEYTYNEFQKPLCKNNQNLYFNMSYSHEYACYIFSLNHKVGVDIEFIDTEIEIYDLLPLITTQEEMLIFNTLDKKDKIHLFYKTWTIKEAFLKALGLGLSHPLSNIETTILPRERFEVIRCNDTGEKEIQKEWTFSSINSLPGYLGAIAIKKKAAQINMITFNSLNFP